MHIIHVNKWNYLTDVCFFTVQVLLSSSLRLPDGQRVEEKEGADGARRLLGAGVAAVRLHRHRQQRPRNATAELRGKGRGRKNTHPVPQWCYLQQRASCNVSLNAFSFLPELLHSQNFVHIRLRQEKALHVICQDVLRQQRRYRCLPQQEDQSHLQALQKEAVLEKR